MEVSEDALLLLWRRKKKAGEKIGRKDGLDPRLDASKQQRERGYKVFYLVDKMFYFAL